MTVVCLACVCRPNLQDTARAKLEPAGIPCALGAAATADVVLSRQRH